MAVPNIPTFAGLAMFGPIPSVNVEAYPCEIQWNSFPGLRGREALIHGSRGGRATAVGILVGSNLTDLANQKSLWFNFQALGIAAVLVDTAGTPWPGAIVSSFRPAQRIEPAGDAGGVYQKYQADFEIIA